MKSELLSLAAGCVVGGLLGSVVAGIPFFWGVGISWGACVVTLVVLGSLNRGREVPEEPWHEELVQTTNLGQEVKPSSTPQALPDDSKVAVADNLSKGPSRNPHLWSATAVGIILMLVVFAACPR